MSGRGVGPRRGRDGFPPPRTGGEIRAEIEKELGFFPHLFEPALETPEVLEELWRQELAANVRSPIPALFRERIRAYVSRYCESPYCLICHSCALRPLGMSGTEILELLERPPPTTTEIEKIAEVLASAEPMTEWPEPGGPLDDELLRAAISSFLDPAATAGRAGTELRRVLGPDRYLHLVAFLAYVRATRQWVLAHPSLHHEDDRRSQESLAALVSEEPRLAAFLRDHRIVEEESQAHRRSGIDEEWQMRVFAEHSPDVFYRYRLSPTFAVEYISSAVADLTGYTPEEVYEDPAVLFRAVHQDDLDLVRERVGSAATETAPLLVRWIGKDGAVVWTEFRSRVIVDADGLPCAVEGIARDVTLRKTAEAALKRSEQGFRELIEKAPTCILVLRREHIVYANPSMLDALGFERPEELWGRHMLDIVDPGVRDAVAMRIKEVWDSGSVSPRGVVRLVHRDGSVLWMEGAGIPLVFDGQPAIVVVLRDVTERRRLEAWARLEDRLTSTGRIAAAVVHEVNNPLSFAALNLDHLAASLPSAVPDSESRRALEGSLGEAREGLTRVAETVRRLHAFARPGEGRTAPVDLRGVVDAAVAIVGNEVRHRARLRIDHRDPPLVQANEARLGQVLANLILNAAQAIPEGHASENEVRVSTRGDGSLRAVVEVSDTGAGIPASDRDRIFDPFFTTKGTSQGTGLGLFISRGIVSELGGSIDLESEPGKGTTFRVSLPAVVAVRSEPPLPATPDECKRRGRVLVVDDEPLVLSALRRHLQREHEVVTATSGRQALDLLSAGERFDAIVCDVLMPELTGADLHAEVSRAAPKQAERMIFVTGGAFTEATRRFLDATPNPVLEKPFDLTALRTLVRSFVE